MAFRLALAALMCVLAAGCSSVRDAYGVQTGSRPHAPSFRDAYGVQTGVAAAYAPPMDSGRKVAEQDCSRPLTLDQGNLRCR